MLILVLVEQKWCQQKWWNTYIGHKILHRNINLNNDSPVVIPSGWPRNSGEWLQHLEKCRHHREHTEDVRCNGKHTLLLSVPISVHSPAWTVTSPHGERSTKKVPDFSINTNTSPPGKAKLAPISRFQAIGFCTMTSTEHSTGNPDPMCRQEKGRKDPNQKWKSHVSVCR